MAVPVAVPVDDIDTDPVADSLTLGDNDTDMLAVPVEEGDAVRVTLAVTDGDRVTLGVLVLEVVGVIDVLDDGVRETDAEGLAEALADSLTDGVLDGEGGTTDSTSPEDAAWYCRPLAMDHHVKLNTGGGNAVPGTTSCTCTVTFTTAAMATSSDAHRASTPVVLPSQCGLGMPSTSTAVTM